MKSIAKKKAGNTKESAAYLAARAAEAEKQSEVARRLARLAKGRFKEARKAFKQAKKFAKQARKEAKAAAKALKEQIKRGRKAPRKKPAKTVVDKMAPARVATPKRKALKKSALVSPQPAASRPNSSETQTGSDITQA